MKSEVITPLVFNKYGHITLAHVASYHHVFFTKSGAITPLIINK